MLAIAALHSAGICHRDIKAENLLLDGSGDVKTCIVKLIDFGLATSVHSSKPASWRSKDLRSLLAPECCFLQTSKCL